MALRNQEKNKEFTDNVSKLIDCVSNSSNIIASKLDAEVEIKDGKEHYRKILNGKFHDLAAPQREALMLELLEDIENF